MPAMACASAMAPQVTSSAEQAPKRTPSATTPDGTFAFTYVFPKSLKVGSYLTAVARDALGNTSEFSKAVIAAAGVISGKQFNDVNDNGLLDSESGLAKWRIYLDQNNNGK